MENNPLTRDDLLEILETIAHAQLKAVRAMRTNLASTVPSDKKNGMSNMQIVCAILRTAGCPLHIQDIILKASQSYGIKLQRESLVSALTKKVLDQNTFIRTAPNTFDLIQHSHSSKMVS